MKIYELIIVPRSPFGTPLKGDTIFGQYCCQLAEDPTLLNGDFQQCIDEYSAKPFAIFTTAWPRFSVNGEKLTAVRRPNLPARRDGSTPFNRREKLESRKRNKKSDWLLLGENLTVSLDASRFRSGPELFALWESSLPVQVRKRYFRLPEECKTVVFHSFQQHNSINRLTGTTDRGEFAPFTHENHVYLPDMELVVWVAADSVVVSPDNLKLAMQRMGNFGFGRDASAGLGRFQVKSLVEIDWPEMENGHQLCLTLGPCVPDMQKFARCYCTPFTRYGRHGGSHAVSSIPFKKPVVMADEGAIMIPGEPQKVDGCYLGTGVSGISFAEKNTVMQGYSLFLPCREDGA
jgi:CRISPR-associated protein Csm4